MTEAIGEGMRRLWSRDLQNIVLAVRNKTFKYEGKPKKSMDWASYNEAQLNELADMLQIIKESVDIAVERVNSRQDVKPKGPGRPPVPDGNIAKVLLLQGYFGVSDRVAGGLLKVFDTKLGISEKFSYKTIERGYDPERTKPIFDEIFKLTNEWSNFNENMAGIDGSGDPTTMKVNYETERSKQRNDKTENTQGITMSWPTKKDFQYSVLSVGIHTKVIAGFSTSEDHSVGELTQAYDVIQRTPKNMPNLGIVVGDTLYANRPFCQTVYFCGAALYSLPKSNVTLKEKGFEDWARMTYELILDPQGFLDVYHNRSISETVNSMMKRREPIPIRKRLSGRRRTAEVVKINLHNLRQSCYLTYTAPALTKTPLMAGG